MRNTVSVRRASVSDMGAASFEGLVAALAREELASANRADVEVRLEDRHPQRGRDIIVGSDGNFSLFGIELCRSRLDRGLTIHIECKWTDGSAPLSQQAFAANVAQNRHGNCDAFILVTNAALTLNAYFGLKSGISGRRDQDLRRRRPAFGRPSGGGRVRDPVQSTLAGPIRHQQRGLRPADRTADRQLSADRRTHDRPSQPGRGGARRPLISSECRRLAASPWRTDSPCVRSSSLWLHVAAVTGGARHTRPPRRIALLPGGWRRCTQRRRASRARGQHGRPNSRSTPLSAGVSISTH